MRSFLRLFALAGLSVPLLASQNADAQTTTPSINPGNVIVTRNVPSRSQNQTPLGINYQDCANDMILSFNMIVTNFDGTQPVQVWAGTSDCTGDLARGIGASQPTCWRVSPDIAQQRTSTPTALPIPIFARDIVGHLNNVPSSAAYAPVRGLNACTTQTTSVAQNVTLYFLPTDSGGHAISGAGQYNYAISVDVVGPQPPTVQSPGDGDTLMIVNWSPNTDVDTAGYDVYIDPIPGFEDAAATSVGGEPMIVCTGGASDASPTSDAAMTDSADESALESSVPESGDDASADAATISDAATSDEATASIDTGTPVDACVYVVVGGSGTSSGTCGSTVLSSSTTLIEGGVSVVSVDDSGDEAGATTTTTSANIGISNIPSNYLLGGSGTGVTVSDKSTGQYLITGLKNGTNYTVVVAAVDGSGNIGPPSDQKCAIPAPVDDFWKIYRQDGGGAGGGFCALEAVGRPGPATVGATSGILALLAFRRRKARLAKAARPAVRANPPA